MNDLANSGRPGACALCLRPPSEEGHDGCIARLPGVRFACCGHGETEAYVTFTNGLTIRGRFDHVECLQQTVSKTARIRKVV